MKTGHSLVLAALALILIASILCVSGCGTKEDDNPNPTDTAYTCDGPISQCLRIKSGWVLDVKTTDEVIVDPSVVALSDGRFRIYANAVGWPRRVISLISTDGGMTFTLEPGDRLVADADHDTFHPTVVALPNGDFRLYMTDQRTHIGYAGAPAIISAVSTDGLNFAWEPGERLLYTGTGDETGGIGNPSVVLLPNGTYRLYYAGAASTSQTNPGGGILSAVSADGLNFTRESGLRYQTTTLCPASTMGWGNPKVYLDQAGTYHLFTAGTSCTDMDYTNAKTGIFEGTSTDGLTFSYSKTAVVEGYYIKSQYHGNAGDPFVNAEDAMLVGTPAGLRMYFACGGTGDNPPVRYYSVYNPSIH